jgi:hypothetical protein
MGKSSRRKKGSRTSRAQVAKQPGVAGGISVPPAGNWFPPVTKESIAAPETKADFDHLKGRWLRPDGGYVIEIREIDNCGKMVTAYFNPRPINVSRTEASREEGIIKIFIELRDANYPGATYNLTYDQRSDQLRGVYFQPALQQSFAVFFVRIK